MPMDSIPYDVTGEGIKRVASPTLLRQGEPEPTYRAVFMQGTYVEV